MADQAVCSLLDGTGLLDCLNSKACTCAKFGATMASIRDNFKYAAYGTLNPDALRSLGKSKHLGRGILDAGND
jgi:hypothetical protein